MFTRRTLCFTGLSLAAPGISMAAAPVLGKPTGKPILTISGRINVTNDGESAVFDRPMLEEMGFTSFQTRTPWYTDKVTFEGVPMTTLMERCGAEGEVLTVTALNDYTSEIPIADFARYRPILAMKRDGKYLEVRDRGPLFVVYPYDSAPELHAQRFYSRSPWQVARIEIR